MVQDNSWESISGLSTLKAMRIVRLTRAEDRPVCSYLSLRHGPTDAGSIDSAHDESPFLGIAPPWPDHLRVCYTLFTGSF